MWYNKGNLKGNYGDEMRKKTNVKKTCSICGKDLSKWNLDFTKELNCGTCFLTNDKDASRIARLSNEVEISSVKKLYDAIKSREIVSPLVISCLENALGKEFHNTSDFRSKMRAFLDKHYYKGNDLRKARRYAGMEQDELAELFEVSKLRIKQMETNKKPLSQDAIDFIRVMGGEKKITLKKLSKTGNLGLGMHNAKNGNIPPERIIPKQQVSGLIRCRYCGELKDESEITIDCVNPYHTFLICEDCYSNRQQGEHDGPQKEK